MATLRFFIREGTKVFARPTFATLASLTTIAAMLLLAGVLAIGIVNVKRLLDDAGENADIAVYVTDSAAADASRLSAWLASARSLPQVRVATLVTKAEAWDRFRRASWHRYAEGGG